MTVDYLQVIYPCPRCAAGGLQYKASCLGDSILQWRECDHCGYRCDEVAAVMTVGVSGGTNGEAAYYEVNP